MMCENQTAVHRLLRHILQKIPKRLIPEPDTEPKNRMPCSPSPDLCLGQMKLPLTTMQTSIINQLIPRELRSIFPMAFCVLLATEYKTLDQSRNRFKRKMLEYA